MAANKFIFCDLIAKLVGVMNVICNIIITTVF